MDSKYLMTQSHALGVLTAIESTSQANPYCFL